MRHLLLVLLTLTSLASAAQPREHSSMWLRATRGTQLPFAFGAATGRDLPLSSGLDTAWDDDNNTTRGIAFIGLDNIGIARISYQANALIGEDLTLTDAQKTILLSRINHIKEMGSPAVEINCDGAAGTGPCLIDGPEAFYRAIKATYLFIKAHGLDVVSIAPFNEPDYVAKNPEGNMGDYGQEPGSIDKFHKVAELLRADTTFEGVRICGGNTLNCDRAMEWYEKLQDVLDEGNTHQLAGDFAHYADFFTRLRADGKVATADELHNVMEGIVGLEYGLAGAIWWGTAERARGAFCRAHRPGGLRLGYAEHRPSWTAGEVMRMPDGHTNAFLGASERQSNTHSYQLTATDRDVYFDGYGPVRVIDTELPGGAAGTYGTPGHCNPEQIVQIHAGADVPPSVPEGRFAIMNKKSKMVISIAGGATDNGAAVRQVAWKPTRPNAYQLWDIRPITRRIGGDFSYSVLASATADGRVLDLLNWGLDAGALVCAYKPVLTADDYGTTDKYGANEQWYFEYAGDGDWYIRSRHSAMALEVKNGSTSSGGVIQQAPLTGSDQQRWRLIDVKATAELTAPEAPAGLTATPGTASVRLTWDANTEKDLAGYVITRTAGGQTDVIGRAVTGTTFIDNTARAGVAYIYNVCARDLAANTSQPSADATATIPAETKALIAHWTIDSLADKTENMLDLAQGAGFRQAPATVGALHSLTFAAWIDNTHYDRTWTRIFDIGNSTSQYMFLCPNNGSEMCFVLKDGGAEQILSTSKLPAGRHHIAVTLDDTGAAIYVDGNLKKKSANITIRPDDFTPAICYIGASQFEADPLFDGTIDDIQIYNYALTADEIATVKSGQPLAITTAPVAGETVARRYYDLGGRPATAHGIAIEQSTDSHGRTTARKVIR